MNGPISANVKPSVINLDRCIETESVNVPREFRRNTKLVDVPKHQNASRATENVPSQMTGRNGLHVIVNLTRQLQHELGNVPRRIVAATVPWANPRNARNRNVRCLVQKLAKAIGNHGVRVTVSAAQAHENERNRAIAVSPAVLDVKNQRKRKSAKETTRWNVKQVYY